MKDLLELTEERTEGRTGAQTAATTSGGQYLYYRRPIERRQPWTRRKGALLCGEKFITQSWRLVLCLSRRLGIGIYAW